MPLVPFATKSSGNRGYSGERLVNLFARPADGVTEVPLIGRGGAIETADVSGSVRGVYEFNAALYAVANGNLVKVVGATVTVIGAVGTSENVCFASNATQMAILIGSAYYVSDGVTVTSYSTGAITTPVWVTSLDGYIIVGGSGQGRDDLITVSGLDDATTFSGLDFAAAEASSDAIVSVLADHSELWVFGEKTIQVFYNSGDADFPFSPNAGAMVERGLHKATTVAKEDNAVFFVGDDLVSYRATGVAPVVISTREIEEKLRANTVHSAITFEERGHKFYAIRMIDAPTLVFDMTTSLWHERTSGTEEQPWFIVCGGRIGSTQYFGTDTGKIVTIDKNTYDDDGQTIVAEAVSSPEYRSDHFSVSRIHLNVEGGIGGIGRTPRIALETSRDGRNWSQERWRDLGGLGDFSHVVEWHGLGAFRRFQVRIRITDRVGRDLYGVKYDVA